MFTDWNAVVRYNWSAIKKVDMTDPAVLNLINNFAWKFIFTSNENLANKVLLL